MADDLDDDIEGDDEPCGHEPDKAVAEPRDVLLFREMLYYAMEPPQHRNPVSGSSQLMAVETHRLICEEVKRCVRAVARRLRDAE